MCWTRCFQVTFVYILPPSGLNEASLLCNALLIPFSPFQVHALLNNPLLCFMSPGKANRFDYIIVRL